MTVPATVGGSAEAKASLQAWPALAQLASRRACRPGRLLTGSAAAVWQVQLRSPCPYP